MCNDASICDQVFKKIIYLGSDIRLWGRPDVTGGGSVNGIQVNVFCQKENNKKKIITIFLGFVVYTS